MAIRKFPEGAISPTSRAGAGVSTRSILCGVTTLGACFWTSVSLAQAPVAGSSVLQSPAAPPATTNAAAPATATGLSEVVVTAQRRSENLQNVPIAVSALDASALANQQISDTQDLQAAVPALRLTTNVTGPTDLQPAMRGAVEQNGGSLPTESPVGIYIDDIYISSLIANNASLADIQQVEVLRGPQGTLYGRNTLTGAIKFTTRTPGDRAWFEAGAGYGSYGSYLGSFTAGAPLAPGLAASISGSVDGTDGYIKDVATGRDTGGQDNYALHGKLHYYAIPRLDVVANVFYSRDHNQGQPQIPATPNFLPDGQFNLNDLNYSAGGPYKNATPVNPYVFGPVKANPYGLATQLISGLNVAYSLPDITLRSISAYVRTTDDLTDDLSGSGTFLLGGTLTREQFTQEFQVQGHAFNGSLRYLAGLFYLHDDGKQNLGWLIGVPLSETFTGERTDSYAAYGQAEYDVTHSLTATLGLRLLEDDKRFSTSLAGIVVPNAGPVLLHNIYRAATPKAELSYKLPSMGYLDSGLIYASATRGFKAGGYNAINVANLDQALSPYGPETDWSYEIGAKADLLDHRIRANVAVFLQDIDGLQLGAPVVAPDGTISFPVQNAGREQVVGEEIDFSARPMKNLLLGLSGSFLDGHYTRLSPGTAAATAITTFGRTVPPILAPYTLTLTANYDIPFSFQGEDARISLGGDLYLSGEYLTDADNLSYVNAYDRLNLYVAFTPSSHWEIRLAAKNVTDDVSFVSGASSLGGYLVLPPREIMVSLKYKM